MGRIQTFSPKTIKFNIYLKIRKAKSFNKMSLKTPQMWQGDWLRQLELISLLFLWLITDDSHYKRPKGCMWGRSSGKFPFEQSQSSGYKLISFSKELIAGGNQFSPAGSRANWLHTRNMWQKHLLWSGTYFIHFLILKYYLISPKYLKKNWCIFSPQLHGDFHPLLFHLLIPVQ